MAKKILIYQLNIDNNLYDFINKKVLPGTNLTSDDFWCGFSQIIYELSPINKSLLEKRIIIQDKINNWHKNKLGQKHSIIEYKDFLKKINYIVPENKDFKIDTENIDDEIANISGPQLVVPITNARYALNAVNARWGSLYDALYGTDVISPISSNKLYDKERGLKVINYSKKYLDSFAPFSDCSWNELGKISIQDNQVIFHSTSNKLLFLKNDGQISGFILNSINDISELILKKNNLHLRIKIDSKNIIGKNDPANISDVILESAISTILDCEDSVATVDAEDKIIAYKNLLGLMKGDLVSKFSKNDEVVERTLNKDLEITDLNGDKKILKSRSLMLIRNVGHLMTTPAILDYEGNEIGEGLMDALITSLISLHDLNKTDKLKNSICNSVYIVKPKMHGPEEVEFTNTIFTKVEQILKIPLNTLKIGIMDEERRTSVNLKECIRAAKSRVAFINTGFLDRTGDEIHTSMYAGPFLKKGDMKSSTWIKAYEKRNVEIGLNCGLQGRAQIGKGMWAMPDLMSEMMFQKINHPKSGANCAWVPSPTAATLHAMHYHQINVKNVQNEIIKNKEKNSLSDLLNLPLLDGKNLSQNEITLEVENNVQGILGYVVRWVDQGIGCSKVPDINNIGLMEDRATCRISSQALANWLNHNIIDKNQVVNTLKKMATIVDMQNKKDINYIPMSDSFNSESYKAAYDLIFLGKEQPSGYTEPILHKRRIKVKNN